jgi:hypothetical protein
VLRVGRWLLLVVGLFSGCGGLSAGKGDEPTASAGSGGTCSDVPADEAGCGGDYSGGGDGEKPLEQYARLRTACRLNVAVNRRGSPVCIDPNIK